MEILFYLLYQLVTYGMWWVVFVALIFCAARYASDLCTPLAFLVLAGLIYYLDVRLVQAEMRKPGWNGTPDLDGVFMFGVLIRIVLVSVILAPVAIAGILLRQRSKRASNADSVV